LFAEQEKPVLERLWDPKTANSLIALKDLAEAAEKVLREGSAHYFAQYPLCSTIPISDQSVADTIAKKLARLLKSGRRLLRMPWRIRLRISSVPKTK
jgi:hypothetical protein